MKIGPFFFLAGLILCCGIGAPKNSKAVEPPPAKPAIISSDANGSTSSVPTTTQKKPEKDFLVMGTGPVVGVYFPAGGAIQRQIKSHAHNMKTPFRLWIESTDGSLANLSALKNGEVDVAIVQSDWHYHAVKGSGAFKNQGPFDALRSVISLYAEPLTLVVRSGADIDDFDDLEGKTVSFGPPGTPTRALMDLVVSAQGLNPETDLKISDITLDEQSEALCNGDVDMIAFAAAHPNGLVQESTSRCEVMLLSLPPAIIKTLVSEHPFLAKASIPGGLYPNINNDVLTIGLVATVVSTDRADEDQIYALVASLLDDLGGFKAHHPVFYTVRKESMSKDGLSAPLHSGAQRYYQEHGMQ